jgi:hypothetical protein
VYVFDVSNDSQLTLVSDRIRVTGEVRNLFCTANRLYMIVAGEGLEVWDLSDPASPVKSGWCSIQSDIRGLWVAGSHAYVTEVTDGLIIVDVSDPESPHEVGRCDTPGQAWGVCAAGRYAYVCDYDALRVIDVLDPSSPDELGFCTGPAATAVVDGRYSYVACGSAGIRVIDVFDPSSPCEVGTYSSCFGFGVAVHDTCAYIADGNLLVLSVSDPTNPRAIGSCGVASADRVCVLDHRVCMSAQNYPGGLRLVDVVDPAAPYLTCTFDTPDLARGVFVSGQYAYVVWDGDGLRIVDVSSPEALQEVGRCDLFGAAVRIQVAGHYAYVAADEMGLRILDVADPSDPRGGCNKHTGECHGRGD